MLRDTRLKRRRFAWTYRTSAEIEDGTDAWLQVGSRGVAAVASPRSDDSADKDDVAAVNAPQDQLTVNARSSRPFEMPDYDKDSFDATRNAVLELASHVGSFDHAFGSRRRWIPYTLDRDRGRLGGLPDREARYIIVEPGLPVGKYQLTVRDRPVRSLRRWSTELPANHGRVELHHPALPAATRSARRLLDLPRDRRSLSRYDGTGSERGG